MDWETIGNKDLDLQPTLFQQFMGELGCHRENGDMVSKAASQNFSASQLLHWIGLFTSVCFLFPKIPIESYRYDMI